MTKLHKAASFTDIHWGAKNNSEQHNQDCLDYIDWFCENTLSHKADHIIFMGDWFETRSAINIATLHYAYLGAKKLNNLGIPIFFMIGNHDLYHRHTRELYSTIQYKEFTNFHVISEPTTVSEIITNPLMCPYIFHHEHEQLSQYNKKNTTWWGHFEFKGFIVTGYNVVMPTGLDHSNFSKPTYIFSGHFHKRQCSGNVVYIGNTFPTNFGDADDNERGMMIYDHIDKKPIFLNWVECPKYTKVLLSTLLSDTSNIHPKSRVKCIIDLPISFEDSANLKYQLTDEFQLREFIAEEPIEISEAISNTETEEQTEETTTISSVDELVIQMLNNIKTAHIDNDLLIAQYQRLSR